MAFYERMAMMLMITLCSEIIGLWNDASIETMLDLPYKSSYHLKNKLHFTKGLFDTSNIWNNKCWRKMYKQMK